MIMLFVTKVTTEVKSPNFHFIRKSIHLSMQQSNLIFFSQTQHGTRMP